MKVPEGKFFTIAGTEYKPGMEIQERHLKMMDKKHVHELTEHAKEVADRKAKEAKEKEEADKKAELEKKEAEKAEAERLKNLAAQEPTQPVNPEKMEK